MEHKGLTIGAVVTALASAGGIWGAIQSDLMPMTAKAHAADIDGLSAEIAEVSLNVLYGQYYDRLDDYEESVAEGRQELAREYARQMERLRAQICEHDPEWERCE